MFEYAVNYFSLHNIFERDKEIVFQPVIKEHLRSAHGMLISKTSMTKELLQERAKDKDREEIRIEKLRSR